jgi:hypothetical protein
VKCRATQALMHCATITVNPENNLKIPQYDTNEISPKDIGEPRKVIHIASPSDFLRSSKQMNINVLFYLRCLLLKTYEQVFNFGIEYWPT